NWQRTITGLPHPHVRRIAQCTAKPDVLYLTLRSEPGKKPWQGGVYKSVDGGQRWMACTKGLRQWVGRPDQPAPMTSNYDRIVVHPANPDVAYVGGDAWVTSTLYKTTDGGTSWTDIVRHGEDANIDPGWITFWGPTVKCLTMSPIEPDVLYFGTSGMAYRTTDGGRRWTPAYCRVLPDGRFRGTGLEVTCLHNISVHPKHPERLYLGYYDIGLLISHDGGRTFRRGVAGIKPHHAMNNSCFDIAFDPADDRHCWGSFGSWSANIGVVAESHDGGLSWKMVGTPEAGLPNARHRALLLDPRERTLFTTADGQGVFASRDGGNSWQPRKTGLPHGHVVDLVLHPRTAGSLWCLLRSHGDEPGGVYHTRSGGAAWQRISRGLVVSDVKALAIAPSDPRRLYLAARQGWFGKGANKQLAEGGVFRSDDGGRTWRRILEDDFAQGLAVDPRNADVVYAGLTDHPYHDESTGDGIVVTRDGGTTWSSLNGTLTCKQVGRITIDPHQPNRLYIGTHGNGAFVGTVQETR
ncbi:hypothetical protein HQ576_06215, partial [bacterium]|nr:hypothetical protein [bacterium]